MSTHADGVAQETPRARNATQAKLGDNVPELWQRFDEKGDRRVRDLVESLNQQLDNLLLFAALFSAINTAFLVYTLPTLSASPQAQTNALLYLLVQGLNNSTLIAQGDVAATATPSTTSNVIVNALFTASLTCSLIASFGAVLGKQWLTYYSRSLYSSPEERRRELQRKIMGADRWHLRGILEVGLSSVLQVALLLFTVGLVIFLQTINQTIAIINTAITAVGLAALAASMLIALWDESCPYQSPLTMFIIPGLFRFIFWLATISVFSGFVLPLGVVNSLIGVYFMVQGRFSEARAKWLGTWFLLKAFYSPSGALFRSVADLSEDLVQSFKRVIEDYELDAASLAWLVTSTRDRAEFTSVVEAVPVIDDRKALNVFAHTDAIARFSKSISDENAAPTALSALLTASHVHIYVAMLDVDSWWFDAIATLLLRYRPAMEGPEEGTKSDSKSESKFPVPAPLYIAGALRSILDHRIYWKWRYNPKYRNKEMEELDAKLRPVITSCATPSAPPRVISMVTLALKMTTGRKFTRAPMHKDVRRSQDADYELVWSSYTSDEPFVKNLAGGILVYAEHRKAPPEETAWPSEQQFTNLLLASHSQIDAEVTAEQLELDGLDLIRGCANLLGNLTGPDEEVQDGDMIEATRELILITIKRIIALGDPSMELLTTEVEILNTLGQLYRDYHDPSILDCIHRLMEHCRSHLTEKPGNPSRKASQQSSHIVAAAGRVLETLDSEEDGYSAFVTKVTDFIEDIVDKTLIDWEDEGTSTTWASNATMLAMVQYIKHLLDRGDVEESRREFATAYAATVDNPRWASLSDERTRKELREALKRLELMNPEKASPVGAEAETITQPILR